MTKRLSVLIIAVMLLFIATETCTAADDLVTGMMHKLGRGTVDILTGWMEFPAQIVKGYNDGLTGEGDKKLQGSIAGIFKGMSHSLGRMASGFSEVLTFWAANPINNEGVGIPFDADYPWEEGNPYDCFDPNFTDGTLGPIGKKFMRGVGNLFLGAAEIPGQMLKESQEGALDLGLAKGVWYWFSRTAQGLSDIFTAFNPNHADQKGLAFDEEWPWDTFSKSASRIRH
jgi:putative exosortase-associated protein (TIGR04073 family)